MARRSAVIGIATVGLVLFAAPAAPAVVLYEQMDAGLSSVASQDFESANDDEDSTAADDFTVPSGESWSIDRVDVLGSWFGGTGGPAAISRVRLYEASGTLPGSPIFTELSSPADGGVSPSFSLPVSGAPALPTGHYWVSVQAIMDENPSGRWLWAGTEVQFGDPAAWQNPGDGFGKGCTTFMARVDDCGVGVASPDQTFRLNGTVGSPDVPPPPPEPPPNGGGGGDDGGVPPQEGGPSNDFSFGKVKKNKKRGTAKLTVNVPGGGELELDKTKKVKADDESAEDAGKEKLSIKPKGKAKKKLNTKGKAKVKANVTYTPDGGSPNTEDKKIKLKKR